MFCAHCGKPLKDGAKFCASCGNAAGINAGNSSLSDRRGDQPRAGHYNKVRRYTCDAVTFDGLVTKLTAWLESQNFDLQNLKTQEGKTLVQIAKRGGWRNLIGMSTALNLLLDHDGTSLAVEIGAGRWIDKAAVGAISWFVLWPLAVTAAIGAWNQIKMPDKIFDFIDQQLLRQA